MRISLFIIGALFLSLDKSEATQIEKDLQQTIMEKKKQIETLKLNKDFESNHNKAYTAKEFKKSFTDSHKPNLQEETCTNKSEFEQAKKILQQTIMEEKKQLEDLKRAKALPLLIGHFEAYIKELEKLSADSRDSDALKLLEKISVIDRKYNFAVDYFY